MTVFFGVVHLDGQPADATCLNTMQVAVATWPLGKLRTWVTGAAALGVCPLKITSQDTCDTQPLSDGHLQLAGHIRLDNRAALQRELQLPDPEVQPDSAYALAAYRRWGMDCMDRLLGDWCLALWDSSSRTLVLARDAGGNTGLCWWSDGKTLVFGNTLNVVLAHPAVPKTPNELMVACYLTNFQDPEVLDATIYAGIKRIRPGNSLQANAQGISVKKWWHPHRLGELRLNHADDYFAAFRELYQDAVSSRLRVASGGKVGLALSSGLDSSSIMALAAPALDSRGQQLQAYVHRPLEGIGDFGPHRNPDEYALACDAAAFVGNVRVTGLRHENSSWMEGIRRGISIHGQPNPGSSSHYWIHDLLGHARKDGVKVLLTGQGGNSTVSWTGTGNVWPALRQGQLLPAFNDLRNSLLPVSKSLRLQLLSPMKQVWRRYRLGRRPTSSTPWAEFSCIHPSFAKEMRLEERMRTAQHDCFNRPPHSSAQLQAYRLEGLLGGMVGDIWQDLGNAFGVDVRDPTRDRRLIEWCWRLPDRIFWAHGQERALIRHGFAGLLPPETLQSAFGVQMADAPQRFRAEQPAISDALARGLPQTQAQRWFDIAVLQASLLRPQTASNVEAYDVTSVTAGRILALLAFLDSGSRSSGCAS